MTDISYDKVLNKTKVFVTKKAKSYLISKLPPNVRELYSVSLFVDQLANDIKNDHPDQAALRVARRFGSKLPGFQYADAAYKLANATNAQQRFAAIAGFAPFPLNVIFSTILSTAGTSQVLADYDAEAIAIEAEYTRRGREYAALKAATLAEDTLPYAYVGSVLDGQVGAYRYALDRSDPLPGHKFYLDGNVAGQQWVRAVPDYVVSRLPEVYSTFKLHNTPGDVEFAINGDYRAAARVYQESVARNAQIESEFYARNEEARQQMLSQVAPLAWYSGNDALMQARQIMADFARYAAERDANIHIPPDVSVLDAMLANLPQYWRRSRRSMIGAPTRGYAFNRDVEYDPDPEVDPDWDCFLRNNNLSTYPPIKITYNPAPPANTTPWAANLPII